MERALALAEKGGARTRPNPLVGAVLVKDGTIIAEGYHEEYGGPHAEVNVLRKAGKNAEGSTLYVTLEPCSHHGKTPPCCEAVIEAKVGRVVCAMTDPNPMVRGRGLSFLRQHGVETESGLLAREAEKLNEVFIHYITNSTPFVIFKTAMSLDGKIATSTGESRWISSAISRTFVHDLRSKVSAIMVGVSTILKDDPLLTTRLDDPFARNPVRVVMDSSGRTPLDSRLFSSIDEAPLIIMTTVRANSSIVEAYRKAKAEVIILKRTEREAMVVEALAELGRRGLDSLLLEGGGTLADSFMRAGAIHKYIAIVAPLVIGGADALTPVEGVGFGRLDTACHLERMKATPRGEDIIVEAYPRRTNVHGID